MRKPPTLAVIGDRWKCNRTGRVIEVEDAYGAFAVVRDLNTGAFTTLHAAVLAAKTGRGWTYQPKE